MFGQHHVHEIPILAAVDSHEAGKSPYGLHHMAGNVAEWVQDWFGFDYYAYMPERNPPGPTSGRYKSVRGGSWKSNPIMLRTATRGGSAPDQRSATIGFRCAKSSPASPSPQQSSLSLVSRGPRASISPLWLSQPACTTSAPSFAPATR